MLALVQGQGSGAPAKIHVIAAWIGGVSSRWITAGSGRPILLVPNPLLGNRAYHPLIRQLSAAFQVLAPELPGTGNAAPLPRAFATDDYAHWLEQYFVRLGLQSALLVVPDGAEAIAFRFASLYPARSLGIVRKVGGRELSAFARARRAVIFMKNAFRHGHAFWNLFLRRDRWSTVPASSTLVAGGNTDSFSACVLDFSMQRQRREWLTRKSRS